MHRMSTQEPTPVGVVGCGRMGRLHARVYSQIPEAKLVGVYDANPEAAAAVAQQFSCRAFTTIEEMLPLVKAVTIATPTVTHESLSSVFIKAKVACLIEKPLAKDVAEASRIAALARSTGTIVQVGHVERFNPIVRALNPYDIKPGFIEVIRVSPFTFRSVDVGVVLDMMIHDIDIVLKFAKSKPVQVDSVGVSVIGDVEDVCNARVRFENGCVANFTASRLALKTERKLRAFSPDAYVSLDYQKRTGTVALKSGNVAALRDAMAKIRSGEIEDISQLNFVELVQIEELKADNVEPLRAELDAFLYAYRTNTRPEVNADDGLAAVELATQIVANMTTKVI
ncbi:Gfo/Idh/MocA family oxidoreductase [soil metagenome]